jgi:hypothetical protein
MVLGIICIVLGVFWGINAFTAGINTAFQQTVQYLGFVCSSIFLVGGFILLKLHTFFGPKKPKKQTMDTSGQ